ncbi:MAG: rhodanese-like domain-containing protein [Polyangiales bacterium]
MVTSTKRSVDDLLADARTQIGRVSPAEAHQHQKAGALLVDIRPIHQRRETGTVPGALTIERNVLEWRLDPTSAHRIPEASSHERQVIILCQQGYASSFAAASLRELGYTTAADVIGGFDAWREAGLPTE